MSIRSELLDIAQQCQRQAKRLEQQLQAPMEPAEKVAVERSILLARREARQALTAAEKASDLPTPGSSLATMDPPAEMPSVQQPQTCTPPSPPQQPQILGLDVAIAPPVICPECGHNQHQKRGTTTGSGHRWQNYSCKACGKKHRRAIATEACDLDACTARN